MSDNSNTKSLEVAASIQKRSGVETLTEMLTNPIYQSPVYTRTLNKKYRIEVWVRFANTIITVTDGYSVDGQW